MGSALLYNTPICEAITTKKVKAINGRGNQPEKSKIAFPKLLSDLDTICVIIENKNGITISLLLNFNVFLLKIYFIIIVALIWGFLFGMQFHLIYSTL